MNDLLEQGIRDDMINSQGQRQSEFHQVAVVVIRASSAQQADLPKFERNSRAFARD
jgi:hypothetical protein